MRKTIVATFLAGVLVAAAAQTIAGPRLRDRKFQKLDVFARVLSYVENNYVEEIDERRLVYGAVKGMVKTLDPHSSFMTPQEFADLRADTDGEFGGVGLEIDDDDGVLVVLEPIPGSPAARAGLSPGDRIVAIDGKATKGDKDDSAGRLRGRPGTPVAIDVERVGWDKPRPFTLTREIIHVQAVQLALLEKGLGYIQIKQFQERTDQEVAAALERVKADSGGRLDGLVLDLRGNPGGLLDQAVRVADLFLSSGVIVSTVGRAGRKLEENVAHDAGTWRGFPIVCLVNGGSASASEILAGALQDHERALVVGTQTFGKGSVQSVIQLDDGSGLKLTVARYLTPSGRSIQERGITPDLVVEQVEAEALEKARKKDGAQRERDLEGHLSNPQGSRPSQTVGRPAEVTKAVTVQQTDSAKAGRANGAKAGAPRSLSTSAAPDPASDHQLEIAHQTLRSWRRFGKVRP